MRALVRDGCLSMRRGNFIGKRCGTLLDITEKGALRLSGTKIPDLDKRYIEQAFLASDLR
ncbi:MAG: hypothetical protein CL534_21035 [Ahrensia sp.]|nr:hypothetical protein [Ahrensia sp.]